MFMVAFSGNNVGNRDITSWDFADMTRSTTDFVISSASLSDGISLVPTWRII